MKGATLLSIALIAGQALSLLRNIITARLLGTEVQGQAMILGLVTSFFATVAVLNTAWQLVQSDRAEDPEFQSSLQGTALLRSVFTATLLLTGGLFLIHQLEMPELQWPLVLTACIPIFEGGLKLNAWRDIRDKKYGGLIIIELAGPIGGAIAAAAILPFNRTIWVFAIVTTTASFLRLVASHLVSRARYQLAIHRTHLREIIRFSWPLIPGGLFFWMNTQSDKLVIILSKEATWLPTIDLEQLGAYGTVAMMIMYPLAPIAKVVRTIIVPGLAKVKADWATFNQLFSHYMRNLMPYILAVATTAIIGSKGLFTMILGEEFSQEAAVAPILSCALVFNFTRMLGYQTGLAKGNNTPQLMGNMFKLSGFGIAILALYWGYGLLGIATGVLGGEILSLLMVTFWLRFRRIAHAEWILVVMAFTITMLMASWSVKDHVQSMNNFLQVLVAIIVGSVVWGISYILLSRNNPAPSFNTGRPGEESSQRE